MEEADKATGPIFEGVVFSIAQSDDISAELSEDLIQVVEERGGTYIPSPDGTFDFDDITHIIATSIDFPRYNDALANGVFVVKPAWIINSRYKGRLADTRPYSPDPNQFFSDVVVTTAHLPEGDRDAVIAGVIAMGGMYSHVLSPRVTHLVCNDMSAQKAKVAVSKGLSCKILIPHWFDDCLKLGRKINEQPYLMPDPEYLRKNGGKIRDTCQPLQIEGATDPRPQSPPPTLSPHSSPSEQRKNLNVFMSRKVMLCDDLDLSAHLLSTLRVLIEYAGATLTTDANEADILVCHFREGDAYVTASRAKKTVGNLSWLYHVINRNKWSNPTGKLLHYPIPRNGLPGFRDMKISISSYSGEARVYIENLVQACGAECTKTMKEVNTHLVTAHTGSEKCDAAQEWNIHVVNHIWLEESYAKCEVQSLTNSRYTHFPARTNLGEVVGQTCFDMQKLEQAFFPEPRKTPMPGKATKASTKMQSSAVLADELPTPEPATKPRRGRPSKSATATPRMRDLADEEKENESPSLQGSGRASKMKANAQLHSHAEDMNLFSKEMKRKGGVIHGGRRSSHAEDFSSPAAASTTEEKTRRKKRPSDEATYDVTAQGSELSDGETQAQQKPAKKAKTKSTAPAVELPPVKYRMLVTGDDRWLDNANKEAKDRMTLRQLGVQLLQDPAKVDILVAPKMLRTRKFVCALASAPLVVDTSYLDHALKNKALRDEPATLSDPEGEARMGFSLDAALARAKANDHQLLRGWHIFVTKDVAPGFDTYKEIVALNGGSAYMYQGRTGVTVRTREDGEGEDEFAYLVSGTSPAEKRLWKTFRDLARKQGLRARVVKNDWLLYAAMAQEVKWDEGFALDGE